MTAPPRSEAGLSILAVDDDPEVLDLLEHGLASLGFSVRTACTGPEALTGLEQGTFDVVLLDVNLPGLSGFRILERMRASGDATPVMMITARDAEEDVVKGLELGADGYVTKPFGLRELAARIEALHRRTVLSRTSVLSLGELRVDERARSVTWKDRELRLTNTEFLLLAHLVKEAPRTISREELLQEVWGMDFDPGTGLVDVHLGNLRRKLRGAGSRIIETVRGEGFRISSDLLA